MNVLNAALNRELSSVDREGQGYAFFRAAEEPGEEGASWGLRPVTSGTELCSLDGHCPLSCVTTAAPGHMGRVLFSPE